MKKVFIVFEVLMGVLLLTPAFADPVVTARVLKDTTSMVAIKLDQTTVFCTARGYGTVQLKVSVPDLAWLAHFDHRVVGETLPCITGGECSNELNPGRFIDLNEPISVVPIRVILTERLVRDFEAKTCERQIIEEIRGYIRGRPFSHYRNGELEALDERICDLLSGI